MNPVRSEIEALIEKHTGSKRPITTGSTQLAKRNKRIVNSIKAIRAL